MADTILLGLHNVNYRIS